MSAQASTAAAVPATGRRITRPTRASRAADDSAEVRRPPEGPNDECGPGDSAIGRWLRQLYYEIYKTAKSVDPSGVRGRASLLIRRTRSRQFWSKFEDWEQKAYKNKNKMAARHSFENSEVEKRFLNAHENFRNDRNHSPRIQDGRLRQVVDKVGYPVLSICLHSESFLGFMETGKDDYADILWSDALAAIDDNAASLELFAKVYHLDFATPIHCFEDDFRLLTQYLFVSFNDAGSGERFGLEGDSDELKERHSIASTYKRHYALNNKNVAEVCQISYAVTQDLKRTYPELVVSGKEEGPEPQEIISDSVILKGYEWPFQKQWASDDPREAGVLDPCACCGHTRGPIPKKRGGKNYPKGCECTFEDYRTKMQLTPEPLVEITMQRLGRSVRALQNFFKGDVVGLYVGEIYPRSIYNNPRSNDESLVGNRYGGTSGGAYIPDQWMYRRHRRGKGTEELTDNSQLEPLEKTEYKRYAIDAVLRGNFTRFINHSCDANTKFRHMQLGQKIVTTVEAAKNIPFGTIITVEYGKDYFINQNLACKCGAAKCKIWNPKNIGKEKRNLGEAFAKGVAPAWVAKEVGRPTGNSKIVKGKKRNAAPANDHNDEDDDDGDSGDDDDPDDGDDDGSAQTKSRRKGPAKRSVSRTKTTVATKGAANKTPAASKRASPSRKQPAAKKAKTGASTKQAARKTADTSSKGTSATLVSADDDQADEEDGDPAGETVVVTPSPGGSASGSKRPAPDDVSPSTNKRSRKK